MSEKKRVAEALEGTCDGGHRHHLINGRARLAQVYPTKLVAAILRGIRQELRHGRTFHVVGTHLRSMP